MSREIDEQPGRAVGQRERRDHRLRRAQLVPGRHPGHHQRQHDVEHGADHQAHDDAERHVPRRDPCASSAAVQVASNPM